MTRRFTVTMLSLSALAIAWAAITSALAHPGHEHKVLGTVTMAASDHVMLQDKDGKDVTVYINADTKVLKDKEPMKVEDIETGMRVVVTAVTENDKMMAKTIELGSKPDAN